MANTNQNNAVREAILIFTKISGWVGGPVIAALFAGRFLDQRYGTAPWYFLGLTALAFLVSTWGIIKETKEYMAKLESQSKKENPQISGTDKANISDNQKQ